MLAGTLPTSRDYLGDIAFPSSTPMDLAHDASGQPDGKREFGIAASSACSAHGILDDHLAKQPVKASATGQQDSPAPYR